MWPKMHPTVQVQMYGGLWKQVPAHWHAGYGRRRNARRNTKYQITRTGSAPDICKAGKLPGEIDRRVLSTCAVEGSCSRRLVLPLPSNCAFDGLDIWSDGYVWLLNGILKSC